MKVVTAMGEITLAFAKRKFGQVLENINNFGNPIREVVSIPLTKEENVQLALAQVPEHTALWQHTPAWHTAVIYIPKRQGRTYGRDMIDLIATGIDSEEKFIEAWKEFNGEKNRGLFPKTGVSVTANSRKRQKSYIVADLGKGPNPNSRLPHLDKDNVDRTHLISAQTTGIENNPGLLIDYDGWLNRTPMNSFENKCLDLSYMQDIIWRAFIYQSDSGLVWEYHIYDSNFKEVRSAKWVDDRWSYIWRYDDYQEKILTLSQ